MVEAVSPESYPDTHPESVPVEVYYVARNSNPTLAHRVLAVESCQMHDTPVQHVMYLVKGADPEAAPWICERWSQVLTPAKKTIVLLDIEQVDKIRRGESVHSTFSDAGTVHTIEIMLRPRDQKAVSS